MSQLLTPYAYAYLKEPWFSSGEFMLRHAVQHLCFTGALQLRSGSVMANGRDRRASKRTFIERGPIDPNTLNVAERFAWDLVPKRPVLHVREFVHHMDKKVPKPERFKSEQVLPVLQAEGLMKSRFIRTTEGRERCHEIRDGLRFLDKRVDQLDTLRAEELADRLKVLGSNLVHLKKETRQALRKHMRSLPDLAPLLNTTWDTATFASFDTMSSFDSWGGDFGGGGDGGDFGGGDGGGGGAGGDW